MIHKTSQSRFDSILYMKRFGMRLLLIVCTAFPAMLRAQDAAPKNLILLIADGAGPASFTMARDFKKYALGGDGLAIDPYLRGSVSSTPVFERYPDSAESATAFATGVKTRPRTVSIDSTGKPIGTLLEAAETRGFWTGIISTSALSDATPAAFSAHSGDRYDYEGTVKQQIVKEIEVLFGGGRQYFEPESIGGQRQDRVNQIEVARRLGYQFLSSRTELLSDLKLPLLGLFAPDHMAYEIDKAETNEPSLVEMTTIAIGMLSRSRTGFVLIVETEGTDDAGHSNEAAAMLREVLAFDEAFKVALDYATSNGETLVVAVSDHDTGGLSIGSGSQDWKPESLYRINSSVSAFAELIRSRIESGDDAAQIVRFANDAIRRRFDIHDLSSAQQTILQQTIENAVRAGFESGMLDPVVEMFRGEISRRAGVSWASTGHTNIDVNLYAFGPGSTQFLGHADNDTVGRRLAGVLGVDLSLETARLQSQVAGSEE